MAELQKAPWSDWETVRLIGRGSFGTVYEIQRKLVDEDTESAALKVITIPQNPGDVEEMYSEGYDDESITATFNSHLKSIVAEYSLMQKMDGSANIVNCKDIRYIQHDDSIGWDIYIRMELLTPLMKALPVDTDEATIIRIGKDICNALVLCKKHEIVHRDIKPQNIFVSSNGDYKLGDFGIAKTVEKTMGGTKIGTYKYMAPEVYNNQPYGSAADIYSLGLVLYWLLNERRMPFMPLPPAKLGAGMDEEARHRRLSGEKLPAPAHGSDELKQIVLKACSYDPKDRYASAAAMLDDLNKLTGSIKPINPIVILEEESEEVKTTGPIFGGAKKVKTEGIVAEDSDATVGPTFAEEPKTVENQNTEISQETEPLSEDRNKKSGVFKYVMIAIGVILAIILFLMLRSCGRAGVGDDPNKGGNEGPSATGVTTEQVEWSAWLDKLPDSVTADNFEIEEKTFYSSRTLEITTSTEKNTMNGWELFDTVEPTGNSNEWSDWSETQVFASDTREVETQTRYRYRDKETTTSTSSNKDGWTQYDKTNSWSDYGSWSGWSTTAASNSESRKVETKTQYRYREKSTTTSTSSSLSGWTLYDTVKETAYTAWGPWYGSSDNFPQNAQVDWTSGTTVKYWHYTANGEKDNFGMTGYFEGNGGEAVGERLYDDDGDGGYYEAYSRYTSLIYRYRTPYEKTTYYFYRWGNWSSWGDTAYSNSSSREVQTQTVYRYCDRSQTVTYHFYRWGGWSDWSTNAVSATNDRQVENVVCYRYRDQAEATTYYFRRWTDWSAYSENVIDPSDSVEVQTKVQYRYKSKAN